MSTAYLNGDYQPLEGLTIPILDRGFLFADGIYEIIPVFQKHPRCLSDHITRLRSSLAAVQIQAHESWEGIVTKLVDASPDADCIVYLQVTRGVVPEGTSPITKNYTRGAPTVFGMVQPLTEPPEEIHAITREDRRWGRCFIKSTMLLETVMATQNAITQEAGEAILYRESHVTEGATSNVFAVIDGMIHTPELSPKILPGVTRKLTLQLLRDHETEYREGPLSMDELRHAEEVWVTGSTRGIMPVTEIDSMPVRDGTIGPVTEQVRRWYQDYCRTP